MKRLVIFPLLAALASLMITGCVTNPITGRSQFKTMSDAEAAQLSTKAYSQVLSEAEKTRSIVTDPAVVNRVRAITDRLVAQAIRMRPETQSWAWEVNVLKDDDVNAWCMAGGKMAVYTGLLQRIRPNDDEIAQVMSHEISHALLSHQAERLSRVQMQRMGLQVGVIAGAIAGYDLRGVAGLADTLATVGLQLPNSRQAESEADRVGIELAARAGYNPQAAVSLWEKMLQTDGGRTPEWLSTHPSPETRLQAVRQLADQFMPVYEAAFRP